MIVEMEKDADIRRIAAAMRQLKGVAKVSIRKDEIDHIPGLPCTKEQRMADILKAEEDYATGRTINSDELKKRMATW